MHIEPKEQKEEPSITSSKKPSIKPDNKNIQVPKPVPKEKWVPGVDIIVND